MSERLTAVRGRKVVSRENAEELGDVSRLLVDVAHRRVMMVVVGNRRKARLVDWDRLSGFGADAIMVDDGHALRKPETGFEQAAASGELELLGRKALSDLGNLMGQIDDISFDRESGTIETILIDGSEHPASSLLGAGSFAVIIHVADDEATD